MLFFTHAAVGLAPGFVSRGSGACSRVLNTA